MQGFLYPALYPKKKPQKKAQKETLKKAQLEASPEEVEATCKLLARSPGISDFWVCTASNLKKKAQKGTLEKGQQKASAAEVDETILRRQSNLLAKSDMSYESSDYPGALHHVRSTPERIMKRPLSILLDAGFSVSVEAWSPSTTIKARERVLKKVNEDRSRHDASPIITRSTVISKATVSEHGWFAGKPCPLNEKHFDLKSLHGKADECLDTPNESDEDKVVPFDDLNGEIEMMPI